MTVTLDSNTFLWTAVLFIYGVIALSAWNLRRSFIRIERALTDAGAKQHDMNVRIVDLETEPESKPDSKQDDDLMNSANSWASQVAAAERGEGVRL